MPEFIEALRDRFSFAVILELDVSISEAAAFAGSYIVANAFTCMSRGEEGGECDEKAR